MTTPAAVRRLACLLALALLCFVVALPAQTPPPPATRLPPAGLAIPAAARAELTAGAATLRREIDTVAKQLSATRNMRLLALLPDVEIYHKAVDWALRYDEFFDLKHVDVARRLLAAGAVRAANLRAGIAPWTEATGTVIRGHRSKLDDSVQPYALHVPADWKRTGQPPRRLDVVLLGRGEKRTELAFIAERERPPGGNDIFPADALVLVPYGRFCNATKFAGEVDVLEALQAVRRGYRVDAGRIVVRGFSMGGASTWHLAAHYPDLWAAAAPGAGFAETALYAKVDAPGKPERMPWERTLWRWYDATGYAANFLHLPVVAYSGELDPQKQAADVMARALAAEGLKLEHFVGPRTAHKFHPETKAQVAARLAELTAQPRAKWPAEDRFVTYTLRYAGAGRVKIMEQEQPWERTEVHTRFVTPQNLVVTTRNVGVFTVTLDSAEGLVLMIDGQSVPVPADLDPSYYWLAKEAGRWALKDKTFTAQRWRTGHPRKMPGLSGPVMDAFMEPFLFVRPTGKPLNAAVGTWAEAELRHATKLWRDLFRGELPVKDDTAVTDDDLATKHLVLWGDASSNRVLARALAAGPLPLAWDAEALTVRGRRYDAAHHAPVLIFPNPLSTQQRYLVLNSGVDFRNEAYGTNSLQTPKLPDFAVIDLREPPGPRWPGRIVDAGFFDAGWK
jgi:dienelactone hydrolase